MSAINDPSHPDHRPAKGQKKLPERLKVTYTLPLGLINSLEMAQTVLRSFAPPEKRGAVNRGVIVEAALSLALQDLETHGPDSQICRSLLRSLP